jgi:hypothetical protein
MEVLGERKKAGMEKPRDDWGAASRGGCEQGKDQRGAECERTTGAREGKSSVSSVFQSAMSPPDEMKGRPPGIVLCFAPGLIAT